MESPAHMGLYFSAAIHIFHLGQSDITIWTRVSTNTDLSIIPALDKMPGYVSTRRSPKCAVDIMPRHAWILPTI